MAAKRPSDEISAAAKECVIAIISDSSTPNGQAMLPLLKQLEGRQRYFVANDVDAFKQWEFLKDVDAIVFAVFAGAKVSVVGDLWELCPKVRWVHSMAAGVETLVPVLKSLPRGEATPLTNAKGAFSSSLAEYALTCMLHFNKQVPRLQGNRAAGVWDKFIMSELRGKTVGFVGLGDIALATVRLCKAFGMKIVANRSRPGAGDELCDEVFYGPAQKLEVFRRADYVLCSLPGGDATKYYCAEAEFAAMKPTAVFLSLGRGTCVKEVALAAALKEGRIAGAALDVFEVEPLPRESPLWSCETLLMSCHNADLTAEYMQCAYEIFEKKLAQYTAPGFEAFDSTVDKEKGY